MELINEFMPQVGDTFNLLNLAPDAVLHGSFANIVLPDLTTGLWDTSGLLISGNILVGSGVTAFPGATNNDQQVTGGDLIAVQQNFGNIATAAVPEPTSVCILILAGLGVLARRRRVTS